MSAPDEALCERMIALRQFWTQKAKLPSAEPLSVINALGRRPVTGKPVDGAGGEGLALSLRSVARRHRQRHASISQDGAALVAPGGSIAGDALADAVDAGKLLDVDVEQVARLFRS